MPPPFLREAGRLLNAGATRSLLLTGNVGDLYRSDSGNWLVLTDLLRESWDVAGTMVLTYELNGPIRFVDDNAKRTLKDAWTRWRTGIGPGDLALRKLVGGLDPSPPDSDFDEQFDKAVGRPTLALELLRQACCCSREHLRENLLIVIEAADLILPDAPPSSLGDADRQRLHVFHDWFSDPDFGSGADSVVLICENRGSLNQRLASMPQVLSVSVPEPDLDLRRNFLDDHADFLSEEDRSTLASGSAALGCQALRQLAASIKHAGGSWSPADLTAKVEEQLVARLGEGVVAFSRPSHGLSDVIGFTGLKAFFQDELVPRLRRGGAGALAGAAVCGPIGAGKSFIFEALAGELGMPVLELKNLRSQWFGQTDVILERLRRSLEALDRVVVMIDEADTQFGGVGAGTHDTERRLTGRIQSMMADPKLRGKVFWLLLTARIDQLSPDLRRPGRAGDLVIPVLDPEGDDRQAFLGWVLKPLPEEHRDESLMTDLAAATDGWSAAAYAALRRELLARAEAGPLDADAVRAVVADQLPPPLSKTRRQQTLLALTHCTRRSLLPDPAVSDEERAAWFAELEGG